MAQNPGKAEPASGFDPRDQFGDQKAPAAGAWLAQLYGRAARNAESIKVSVPTRFVDHVLEFPIEIDGRRASLAMFAGTCARETVPFVYLNRGSGNVKVTDALDLIALHRAVTRDLAPEVSPDSRKFFSAQNFQFDYYANVLHIAVGRALQAQVLDDWRACAGGLGNGSGR